jgi:general stress protein 26
VIRDRALIEDLWRESWRIWFPDGMDDPMLCLLAVEPRKGEYWDSSGIKGLTSLFKGALAYLRGKRMETDEAHAHAKVDLE